MKKLFRTLIIVAICGATIGMVSCKKDNDGTDDDSNNNYITVTWIDLGLPSGLLWAECNLGATTPDGYGKHYAWGAIYTSYTYEWSTCPYAHVYEYSFSGEPSSFSKYVLSDQYGVVDNKTVLEAMDDAATVAYGPGARIPTKDEWQELIDNTTIEWTTEKDVDGFKLTAANGNSLFLPAERHGDGDIGTYFTVYYWSSSLGSTKYAWNFSVYYEIYDPEPEISGPEVCLADRYLGKNIRAVRFAN